MARTRSKTSIRAFVLTALLTAITVLAPWRLMQMAVEVVAMKAGPTRFSQADDQYWDAQRMERKIRALGYEVYYQRSLNWMNQPVYGLTIKSEHTVSIESDLHWNARYAVLTHEAGHILSPYYLDRSMDDVFAETVAALVTGGLPEHARYLTDNKLLFLSTAAQEWPALYHAAAVLQD